MILHDHSRPPTLLLSRDLYSPPPPARTSRENNPTLLVSWWCTGFALAIILVRVAGRYIRTERLFREDKIMALSIIPLMIRMGLVHMVLLWGTNNAAISGNISAEAIRRREIGSRLVLVSRIMYAMFLWIAKFTISEFLKRLTSQVWKRTYELGLRFIRYFLLVTFLAVVVATLAECQPFTHYWQVMPDPGAKCRQGVAQLMTMATSDVLTDILLVGFPIPIVLKSNIPLKRKCSLILLFALSLILVAITIYRVVGVIERDAEQQFRSLLASLEILAAAAVSNALVLGSFVRDRGTKKQRWRYGSQGGHSSQDRGTHTPRRAITRLNWGSDADLVQDLGMRCAPELSEKEDHMPRPAPVALPSARHAKNLTPPRRQQAPDSLDLELKNSGSDNTQPSNTAATPTTPRISSFFDVGGLLGDTDPPASHRQHSIAVPQHRNFSRPTTPLRGASIAFTGAGGSRKGSDALLEDIGGLHPPDTAESESLPIQKERRMSLVDVLREAGPNFSPSLQQPHDRAGRSPPEIQDIGGLLSPNSARTRRPSTADKRDPSPADVLRQSEPNRAQYHSYTSNQMKGSSSEIQDVGGLLAYKPTQEHRRPSPSDTKGKSLVDVLRETAPSMPAKHPRHRKPEGETIDLQDVGGLLNP